MELISIIILFGYGVLIIALVIGFDKVAIFDKKNIIPINKFTIIIPFRNEVGNLGELLNSIAMLNYPKENFEILMVDDDSDDDSVLTITNFKIEHPSLPIIILKNQRKSISPKKDAINTAINNAQFDWIVTTDADCVVPKTWLLTFDTFIQTYHPKLIAAPVTYNVGSSFLEQFQLFDFLSLQASTIGGFGIKKPFLCNGANLCYQKSAFTEVNGFIGNEHIASGDDVFLMEKIKERFTKKVIFLKSKDAVVFTKPQPALSTLVSQRVRWASKTSSVDNPFIKVVGVVVFLMNFLLIFAVILFLIKSVSWQYLLLLFGIKLVLDFALLIKSFKFFKQSFNFIKYVLSSLCYPFFSIYVILLSFKKGYHWKKRMFKT